MVSKIQNSKFKIQNFPYILALLILLMPGIIGLLHPGFPVTDDGSWMIVRFSAFYDALRHGQFPVRFLPRLNHGYGYPVADFLYPLFMYLGVPIHLLKISYVNTIKIIFGASFMLSSIFCFLWLRKLFNALPAFLGAFVYAFFPYHLYDIYKRGSVGEVLALCIVPFILWQVEVGKGKRFFAPTALGIALLILSHNTLALLFLPMIIIYMFVNPVGNGFKLFPTLFLSLCLSAFFWLPALYDKQFTVFDTTSVSDFSQYFLSGSTIGLLGVFSIAIIVVSFSFVTTKEKKNSTIVFFLLVTLISVFLSSSFFAFVWHILPLPKFVQFPFRFLSITILGIAFLTAAIIARMKTVLKTVIVILCILLIYASAWKYIFPSSYQMYPDGYYATNEDTTTVQNEYMPIWVQKIPVESPKTPAEIVKGNGSLTSIMTNNPNKLQFTATLDSPSIVRVNTIYFPGWNMLANNKQQQISYNNEQGVIDVHLNPGNYHVVAKFGETPLRLFADILSLISVLLIIIIPMLVYVRRLSVTKPVS